jgi:DNA-damage-inducible protein J
MIKQQLGGSVRAVPVDMSALSDKALSAELEKGYADMKAGRTQPASKVFADIRKEYNLESQLFL